jgi:hypothetical protein
MRNPTDFLNRTFDAMLVQHGSKHHCSNAELHANVSNRSADYTALVAGVLWNVARSSRRSFAPGQRRAEGMTGKEHTV